MLHLVLALAIAPGAQTSPSPSPSPSPAVRCDSFFTLGSEQRRTQEPCTVPPGTFDVETEYTNVTFSGPNGGNTIEYPQALLRLGTVNPRADVEITFPSEARSTAGSSLTTGSTDVEFALKYQLETSDAHQYALTTGLTVPTGSPGVSGGNAQFREDFDFAYPLGQRTSLSGTLSFEGLSSETNGVAQSYFNFEPSILFAVKFPDPNSSLSAEYVYDSSFGPNYGGFSSVDFNFTHQFGPHAQVEVEYGFAPSLPTGDRAHYIKLGVDFLGKN